MADPSSSSSPEIKNGTVSELQQIYQMISDRSEGRATNEDVEAAVSRLLLSKEKPQENNSNSTISGSSQDAAVVSTTTTTANATRTCNATLKKPPPTADLAAAKAAAVEGPIIDEDMEDYDDDDNETPSSSLPSLQTKADRQQQLPGRKRKRNAADDAAAEPDWSLYREIPLGKEGAKMMTTFGDCRAGPDPAAVEATLLGARSMLQAVLQDARHIRRKYRKVYRHAKETLRQDQPQKPVQQEEWTAELLFKALKGYDPQATAPPCGFGMQELRQLCPEEMNAYTRWNAMHEAAIVDDEKQNAEKVAAAAGVASSKTDKNGDDMDNDDADADDDNADVEEEEEERILDMALTEGHLQERAEQFDLRTDRMEKGWYLKFSNIRRGSFLPRRTRNDPDNTAWQEFQDREDQKKNKHRLAGGTPQRGVWSNKPLNDIRFLHWVGFDPQSALPPPNKDTTHALAFIAHDFVGRIVEKAILLRNQQKEHENGNNRSSSTLVLNELQAGERLEKADIERAMQDPDIKPQPIYSVGASSGNNNKVNTVGTQLYFGPGFEKRLELEMEEIIQAWAKKKDGDLPEEELQIRQEEQELFQKLSAPPSLGGIAGLLVDPNILDEENDMVDDSKPAAAKKKRAVTTGNNENTALHSTAASEALASSTSEQQEMQSPRLPKRGRPKGSKNKPKAAAAPPPPPPPMEQQDDETGSMESAPRKRKVGRPKGSKAKPKAPPS